MHFVRRGVAKAVPEKIELTEKELEKIIKQTAEDLKLTEAGDDQSDEEGEENVAPSEPPADPNDEFNFENYDQEDNINPVGIGTVATLPNLGDLSENVQIRTEGPDSDEEDDIIKPNDNLLLVGHVESDASVLEVYIYNKEEDSFYVHHDIILPWFPLCIEWLSHDPTDPNPGNLCALGGMDPVIQVWDLDIENCLEPAFKLGKKPNKKKKTKRVGHKDAVLDLSWNRNFTHVLASGSADSTVLLWDLDQGTPHTKIDSCTDKPHVTTLAFHPLEAQTLLGGGCDGFARAWDCRAPDACRAWSLAPEIERVVWDTQNPYCFAVSTSHMLLPQVQSLAFHPLEAQTLLGGGCDGFARAWDCRAPDACRAWSLAPEIERVVWDTQNPYCFAPHVTTLAFHPLEAQTLLGGGCDGFARAWDCRAPDACRAWSLAPEIERVVWDTQNPYCFAVSTSHMLLPQVQSLAFHPLEAQTLLGGGCDGFARAWDCRAPDACRAWSLAPEIERVVWDTQNPYCFATLLGGGCDGFARAWDCRAPDACRAWSLAPEIERVVWDTQNPYCFAVSTSHMLLPQVQSLAFHPLEAQTLLGGGCDGFARAWDCRAPDACRAWSLAPEIERVVWDTQNPYCFAMSNNTGKVAYVDCRQDTPLWTLDAHDKEVTGLILSDRVPGLMITVSTDEKLKTWDISVSPPAQVSERACRVGQALCAALCPDAPYSVAVGGDNKQNYIEMLDLQINEQFTSRFASRPLIAVATPPSGDAMET
ncbi:unnamed protein product [Chrysodeixis includens]|uniref:Uncharacterized protein n=1 Tax=Chrysodeixis includens TaxID=689277 RepID=A0A9N8PX59_CHRIL|nr:unnamed protein product [Chrysodeixis includens]